MPDSSVNVYGVAPAAAYNIETLVAACVVPEGKMLAAVLVSGSGKVPAHFVLKKNGVPLLGKWTSVEQRNADLSVMGQVRATAGDTLSVYVTNDDSSGAQAFEASIMGTLF
jgi:hypothetical protein